MLFLTFIDGECRKLEIFFLCTELYEACLVSSLRGGVWHKGSGIRFLIHRATDSIFMLEL